MPTTTPISAVLSPAASARVAELKMERELEAMLEHARQTVPGLRAINVETYQDPDEPGQLHVHLIGWRDGMESVDDRTEDEWGSWLVSTFPPEVARWFAFLLLDGTKHAS